MESANSSVKNLWTFLYIIRCDFSPDNWIHELALVKIIDIRDYLNVDDQQENLHTAPGDHSNAQEERLSS